MELCTLGPTASGKNYNGHHCETIFTIVVVVNQTYTTIDYNYNHTTALATPEFTTETSRNMTNKHHVNLACCDLRFMFVTGVPLVQYYDRLARKMAKMSVPL